MTGLDATMTVAGAERDPRPPMDVEETRLCCEALSYCAKPYTEAVLLYQLVGGDVRRFLCCCVFLSANDYRVWNGSERIGL